MSSETPPLFTITPPETPLDLTVRRTEFDDVLKSAPTEKQIERQMSLPSNLDFQYGLYANRVQYTSDACDSTPHTSREELSPSSSGNASRSSAASPTLYTNTSSFVDNVRTVEPSSFEGSMLPKKRKHLWRPYDSRAVLGELDRDGDSSDSASGSSSDQEFKIPQMDPVKKRKIHMLQYESEDLPHGKTVETGNYQCEQPLDDISSHVNKDGQSSSHAKHEDSWTTTPVSELSSGYFTNMAEDLTKSQLSLLNSYPEARDKMISGLKKRDIFGWGLKLMKQLPEGCVNVQQPSHTTESESSHENSSQNVCQDGEKTYIELQTVRSNSSPPREVTSEDTRTVQNLPKTEADKSPFKSPKPFVSKSDSCPTKVQTNIASVEGTKNVDVIEQEKENINIDRDRKVYIQTRDNVIKGYDETKNVPVKTKKGISLIDLVEEIEATARAKTHEFEDEKARHVRNKRVTALLDQCNHVKLQALDFLMANVLIQDREPQYKQKNEKVQKMLKGDKISSVNMLDVLELQVEIGLN